MAYVALRSYNYPDFYIRHRFFVAELTQYTNQLDLDAIFEMVPGLADPNQISFKSVNYPDYYLRHHNFQLKLHPRSDDQLFAQDATFIRKPGKANTSLASFESYNYRTYFIRHKNWQVYLETIPPTDNLAKQDSTFYIVEVPRPQTETSTTKFVKPTITASQLTGSLIKVSGSGFKSNSQIRIRVVVGVIGNETSVYTTSNANGSFEYTLPFSGIPIGTTIWISATDGRPDPTDLTGFLWSNTVPITYLQ